MSKYLGMVGGRKPKLKIKKVVRKYKYVYK